MARNSVIKAVITGDTKGLDRALGGAETSLGKFGRNAGLALAGVAGVAGAAFAVGKPLVDAASNYEEALNKVNEVFDASGSTVEEWASTTAGALGIASTDALTAAGNFAAFGSAAGLSGDDLATFSTDLTAAAADLGSFNNIDTADALQKLQAGLAGEAEPLRRLGIFLDSATVAAKAAEMGLGGLTGELTDQEKVLARNAVILEQMGEQGALGDFARTSGSLANQQKILSAKFSDVQAKLGQKLLPVAVKAAEIALDLVDGFSKVVDIFSEEGLAGVLDRLEEKFAWFGPMRDIVGGALNYIQAQAQNLWDIFDGLLTFVKGVFSGEWGQAWEGIKQAFDGVWNYMVEFVSTIWTVFFTAAKAIGGYIVGGLLSGIGNLGSKLWDLIKAGWDYAVKKFNQLNPINFADKIPIIRDLIKSGDIDSDAALLSGLGIQPAPVQTFSPEANRYAPPVTLNATLVLPNGDVIADVVTNGNLDRGSGEGLR